MQQCKKCSASWTFSKVLEKCPFCGEILIDKNKINSIEDALRIVFREHGISTLRESGRLLGLLGDYAPSLSKERGLIKIAVESGAYAALFDAIGLSEAGRQQVINRYVEVMAERFYVAENWARQSITWCINALDLTDDRSGELVHDQAVDVKKQQADATSQFSPIISTAKNKEPTPKLEMPKDAVVSNGVLKKYNGSLDIVQFPSGIIEIGAQAFYGNERIRRIVLPNTVRKIGKSAFSYCSNLSSIELGNNLIELGDWAFIDCKALTSIHLPDSLQKIGEMTFQGCSSLEEIDIPTSLQSVEELAFNECSSLKRITVSRNTKIHKDAFGYYSYKPNIDYK